MDLKNVLSPAHDELDLKQADAITKYFSNNRVDFIILAAGLVGGIADNSSRPYDYIAENLHIFLNVCTNAKLHQVKRIVLLGSSCMYPLNTQQPIPASALYSRRVRGNERFICDIQTRQYYFWFEFQQTIQ